MVTCRLILFVPAMTATLLAIAVPSEGQQSDETAGDIIYLRDFLVEDDTALQQKEPFLPDSGVSDAGIAAHFMIRLYQTFVSSQQHNVCVFIPSCSHFGAESMQKCGFVRGVLLTADRLTRCNSFAGKGGYAFDPSSGKYIDTAEFHCCGGVRAAAVSCPSCGGPRP